MLRPQMGHRFLAIEGLGEFSGTVLTGSEKMRSKRAEKIFQIYLCKVYCELWRYPAIVKRIFQIDVELDGQRAEVYVYTDALFDDTRTGTAVPNLKN